MKDGIFNAKAGAVELLRLFFIVLKNSIYFTFINLNVNFAFL